MTLLVGRVTRGRGQSNTTCGGAPGGGHYYSYLYSTVQYSIVRYSSVHHSTVRYSTVQYSKVLYSTLQYSTVSCPRFDQIEIRLSEPFL